MRTLLYILLFFCIGNLSAQNYWERTGLVQKQTQKQEYLYYTLDKEAFSKALNTSKNLSDKKNISVQIPNIEGIIETYYIQPTQVLSEELAQQHPEIKTFVGISVKNPAKTIRFTWSPFGLNAIMEENFDYSFIESVDNEGNSYKVYRRNASHTEPFQCKTIQELNKQDKHTRKATYETDNQVRTFKIAIAATNEFTQYFGGKAAAFAQVVSTINRINQVYGNQLSIQFQLVSGEALIFDSAATDPFANIDYDAWYDSSSNTLQTMLDTEIGSANYHIGHLFHNQNLGGNAGCIGCVCTDGRKGRAFSAVQFIQNMDMDFFDIDIVAHEIGHQMGAYHTFSYEYEGTNSQMEPGSGSTIMGYAGVLDSENVQSKSDTYFHHRSVYDIMQVVKSKTCATVSSSSNTLPTIDEIQSYTIPYGTAYLLEGSATDSDGDTLYYTWEQSDSRTNADYVFSPSSQNGATARSLTPTTSPKRYIPRLSRIVTGNLTQTSPAMGAEWETVLTVGRTLNWSFMVLDRNPDGTSMGNTAYKTIQVVVSASEGPFQVTSQTEDTNWFAGQNPTITWNVANTNTGAINTQNVTVLFSTDGGATFPYTLASGIANNGSAKVPITSTHITSNGRFMIKAEGNIFLAVNAGTITVKSDEDTDGDGILSSIDNCPEISNADQADSDNDGIGDVCDEDWDGDNVLNTIDNCPRIANADQADLDNDGLGDVCDDDTDDDGILNTDDNCPYIYNTDQADLDGDNIGDLCDNDIDGDGIDNSNDTSLDYVLISNAFTPNNDGLNDYFDIVRAEEYPNNTLRVYNHLGQLVYETKGYKNQWNGIGSKGEKVPQGSYFYIFTLDNTEVYNRQGWIFINY
ncbi:MAG: thrombospondin type 3 repeat-containing protein [Capnocytophaga sp.]|nr:thrombospondin type 3 repeat-containing protein [Capnocytophaga sp.]